MVIQAYAPTSNSEEAEVERFYEDLQDLLELTPQKDVLFMIGDWNAKVGSQETPGVTGKFGLGIRNEAGQRLIEFGQESFRRNGVALTVNRRVQNAVLGCSLKNDRMILVHFQGKPFNITVIQVYAPLMLKKLEWTGSIKTYNTFSN